ncbi:glycoside hydrolase family 43 protein [Flaviramulus sp. BrNp1-15]|uniref:glycoside hydrolase family 43 protein n=1 Tax=Flaviramulus sp. BrNp1-15 TaxID=2916754 RepID=UPI001EE7F64A|nr:glycoside hydrolase family 43 protein [Flaviramulus sp. BrNp1-15]ULC60711.1 glycoside hydrolase family 43 protein [Flaviramulus sp. BrNp1-15]
MKNSIVPLFLTVFIITISCTSNKKESSVEHKDYVAFDWFNYEGKDEIYNKLSKSDDEYYNPILSGFYPDPSICKANDKYYLINSSFSYFPGIPIFESTDLVNWKQLGHVITRKEQGDFSGLGVSRGMFAPTIRYHQGTFYVICTNVDGGGNFIVTTQDPAGEWSNPILLPEVNGIDPDIFFDDNGRVYITHNGPPPNNITKHDGHRAIYTWEYSLEQKKIISEQTLLVDGGTDMAKKPVWIEAPHILKKDGYYYLICAEGGTAYNHSEVVFRSKNVLGPYVSYENNPILTQRHLNKERPNQITTTGHADFVETNNGDWWGVYLGCRPYEIDYYNTGRETFMLPVTWKDGWPTFESGNEAHPFVHKKPDLPKGESFDPLSGNFTSNDDFSNDKLDFKYNFIRNPLEKWHKIEDGFLYIKPRKENIKTETNFSFIGRRQQHQAFEVSTKLNFTLTDTLQTAGLAAFQNEKNYLFIGKRLNAAGQIEVFLEKTATKIKDGKPNILAKNIIKDNTNELYLMIEGKVRYYDFYYKLSEDENWKPLIKNVDAINLSTAEAGGFVGTYLALYTSSNHF